MSAGRCEFKHYGIGRCEIIREGRIDVWRDEEGGRQGGQYGQSCIKISL